MTSSEVLSSSSLVFSISAVVSSGEMSLPAGVSAVALYYAGGEGEPDSPTMEEYAICVTKGQDELLAAINEVLAELGKDGVDALVKKHMGIED